MSLRCLALALAVTLAACGGDTQPVGDDDDDDSPPVVETGDTGTPVDTAPVDTSDTAPVDTGDTAPVDTADTAPVDTGDTAPVDTADTAPVDTGDTDPPDGSPVVADFDADPPGLPVGGGEVTLTWDVTGADTVTIDGLGVVTGDRAVVEVDETTLFTLTATNADGSAEATTLAIVATDAPPPVERDPTTNSVTLVEEALEDGEIDAVDALRYQVFAMFGDPRLPARFESDAIIHGSQVMRQLTAALDDLPPAVQDELRPFTLPPTDPNSWYQPAQPGARQMGLFDEHVEIPVDGGNVWVWWRSLDYKPEARESAGRLVRDVVGQATETGWEKLLALMQRPPLQHLDQPDPDDVYHVFVVASPSVKALGWTQADTKADPASDGRPTHVVVNVGVVAEALKAGPYSIAEIVASTTTHELMHAFQNAYDVAEYGNVSHEWLAESSATWSEHHVFPTFDTEHAFADDYLEQPLLPLDALVGSHEYGGYLFHLYVDERIGVDTIRQMWANAKTMETMAGVVAAVGDWERHFATFTAFNWNNEPTDWYFVWDDLNDATAHVTELGFARVDGRQETHQMLIGGASPAGPLLGVPSLSAQYFHFDLSDVEARSILLVNGYTFEVQEGVPPDGTLLFDETYWATELSEEEREGAYVYALVKANGAWLPDPVDLTDVAFVPFCQLYAEESAEEIVLVFGNSRYEVGSRDAIAPKGLDPALFVSNMACGDWAGTASVSTRLVEPGHTEVTDVFFGDLTFERPRRPLEDLLAGDGQTTWFGIIVPDDVPWPGLFAGEYELTTADVTWSTEEEEEFSAGLLFCVSEGSGTLGEQDVFSQRMDLSQSLTDTFGHPNSLYRSYMLDLGIFTAPGSVTETCSDGSVRPETLDVFVEAGFRGPPLFEVSEDGLLIQETWLSDDGFTEYEVDLVGISD